MQVNVILEEGLSINIKDDISSGDTGYLSEKLGLLAGAIGTSYIPLGNTIQEMVSDFMSTQMARTFNPGCGFPASLEMEFNEQRASFLYASTSGTCVNTYIDFDTKSMTPIAFEINVFIDGNRALPGRCHYEGITKLIPRWDWENPILEEMKSDETKTPVWMQNQMSSQNVSDEQLEEILSGIGFTAVPGVLQYRKVWMRGDDDWIALVPEQDLTLDEQGFLKFKLVIEGKSCNYDSNHSFYLNEVVDRLTTVSEKREQRKKRRQQYEEQFDEIDEIDYEEIDED